MKKKTIILLLLIIVIPIKDALAQTGSARMKVFIDGLLKKMTLDEKIGQMNQYNGDWSATGPITQDGDKQNQIRKGMVGSMLNVTGFEHTKTLQEIALTEPSFPYHWPKQPVGIWKPYKNRHASPLPKQQPPGYTGRSLQWWTLPATPVGEG
jgi:hypothetical protein